MPAEPVSPFPVSNHRKLQWLLLDLAFMAVLVGSGVTAMRLGDRNQSGLSHAFLALLAVGSFIWMRMLDFYPSFQLYGRRPIPQLAEHPNIPQGYSRSTSPFR